VIAVSVAVVDAQFGEPVRALFFVAQIDGTVGLVEARR
jgi:hypothetical protein